MHTLLRNSIPVAAGVAAGVLTSLAVSRPTPEPRPSVVVTTPHLERPAPPPPHVSADNVAPQVNMQAELDALRTRMGQIEAREHSTPTASQPPPPVNVEESRRIHEDEEREALDRHARESIDAQWSARAVQSLESDLEQLQVRAHGRAVRVDCRTTMCVATMEWPTHTEAVANYAHLLHGDYEVNCTRSILLHEPDDPTRPYQARLVFRCGDRRPTLAGP